MAVRRVRASGLASAVLLMSMLTCRALTAQSDFIRGDADGDGEVHFIVDAAFLSEAIFGGGTPLACFDAGDVNDDGTLGVMDLSLLVGLGLVVGPGSLPMPFPTCGPDPTPDGLTCAVYTACSVPAPPIAIDPGLVLGFSPPDGFAGGIVSVDVTLDNAAGSFSGWSFGVCHDSTLAAISTVLPGPTLTGLAPDFEEREVVPGAGWSASVLLSFGATTVLGPGSGYVLYTADYDHFGVGDSALDVCEIAAPLSTFVAFVESGTATAVEPTVIPGSLAVTPLPAGPFIRGDVDGDGEVNFIADAAFLSEALFGGGTSPGCFDAGDFDDDGSMDLADISVMLSFGFVDGLGPVPPPYPTCGLDPTLDALPCDFYDGCTGPPPPPIADPSFVLGFSGATGTPGDQVTIDVTFDNLGGDLAGWSFGVCHDPTLAAILAVDPGGTLLGLGPDFEARSILPAVGWTAATLLSFTASTVLGPGTGYELYTARYDVFGLGDSSLTVCAGLGFPPVPITFVGSGGASSVLPVTEPGSLEPVFSPDGPLIRGDANVDGTVDLADTIYIIAWNFVDGPEPPCFLAADANDDGTVNVADAIWLVNYIFLDGPTPPEPFPACGFDPSADGLTCNSYPPCA